MIVAVIDDGADYEYRYVGDAERRAFRTISRGCACRSSRRARRNSGRSSATLMSRCASRASPLPFAVRAITRPISASQPHHETAFLPLGAGDGAVDHILIVGVQIPHAFWKLSDAELAANAPPVG